MAVEGDKLFLIVCLSKSSGEMGATIFTDQKMRDSAAEWAEIDARVETQDVVFISGVWMNKEDADELEAFNNGTAL